MTNANPNAPAYRWLLLFWLFNALNVLFSVIDLPVVLFSGEAGQITLSNILALAAAVAQFYPFYQLGKLSDRLHRAFTVNIISVCAAVVGLISLLIALTDRPPYNSAAVITVMSLVVMAGVICLYVSQFFLYTGLEALRAERGYDYPSRLIRLCFFVPLICDIAAVLLDSALKTSISLFSKCFCLIELGLFVRAARKSEIA